MTSLPKILVIDDVLGRDLNEPYRVRFCEALKLKDADRLRPANGDSDYLAEATFISGQRNRDGWIQNDPDQVLRSIREGWPFKTGKRWALVCLDLRFGEGHESELETTFFGLELLERILSASDLWGAPGNQVPVVMLSADDPGEVEKRAVARLVGERGPRFGFFEKWADLREDADTSDARKRFCRLLFRHALVEDGAMRVAGGGNLGSGGKASGTEKDIHIVDRTPQFIGSSPQLLSALRNMRSRLLSANPRHLIVEVDPGEDANQVVRYIHKHRIVSWRYLKDNNNNRMLIRDEINVLPVDKLLAFKGGHDTFIYPHLQRRTDAELRALINFLTIHESNRRDGVYQVVATMTRGDWSANNDEHWRHELGEFFDTVRWPALCDRRDDVPAMFRHELKREDPEDKHKWVLEEGAVRHLQAHSWPANTRELRAVAAKVAIAADIRRSISAEDISDAIAGVGATRPGAAIRNLDQLLSEISAFQFEAADLPGAWPRVQGAINDLLTALFEAGEAANPGRGGVNLAGLGHQIGVASATLAMGARTNFTVDFVKRLKRALQWNRPIVDRLLTSGGSIASGAQSPRRRPSK